MRNLWCTVIVVMQEIVHVYLTIWPRNEPAFDPKEGRPSITALKSHKAESKDIIICFWDEVFNELFKFKLNTGFQSEGRQLLQVNAKNINHHTELKLLFNTHQPTPSHLSLSRQGVRGQRSESSILLQFLEQSQAAEVRLPLSVLPQNQQVVRGACDQTVLLEAHKHLNGMRNYLIYFLKCSCHTILKRDILHVCTSSYLHCPGVSDQVPGQLQSPRVGDIDDLLCRRTGLFVWTAKCPHPKEPWVEKNHLNETITVATEEKTILLQLIDWASEFKP